MTLAQWRLAFWLAIFSSVYPRAQVFLHSKLLLLSFFGACVALFFFVSHQHCYTRAGNEMNEDGEYGEN